MLMARSLLLVTVKLTAPAAVPSGVETRIGPVPAFGGTVARISVEETTVKFSAVVVLKETFVTLKKLVPKMVTTVPTGPSAGVKPVMLGCTRKLLVLMMTPPGVVTVSGPVIALVGITAEIRLDAVTVKSAAAMNNTPLAPVKLAPVMMTLPPTTPFVGENPARRGGR